MWAKRPWKPKMPLTNRHRLVIDALWVPWNLDRIDTFLLYTFHRTKQEQSAWFVWDSFKHYSNCLAYRIDRLWKTNYTHHCHNNSCCKIFRTYVNFWKLDNPMKTIHYVDGWQITKWFAFNKDPNAYKTMFGECYVNVLCIHSWMCELRIECWFFEKAHV